MMQLVIVALMLVGLCFQGYSIHLWRSWLRLEKDKKKG